MDKNSFICFFFIMFILFSSFMMDNCKPTKKVNIKKRVLQEVDEVPFKKLDIYYDLVSFYGNIEGHENWEKNKATFKQAMDEVKAILEEYIEIRDNEEQDILYDIGSWNIGVFDEEFFGESDNMDLHNFYIFFKVGTLKEENNIASSKIIEVDSKGTPKYHIITLNNNIPNIEFPLKFFKTLLLHQLTHLLGFHISEVEDNFEIGIIKDVNNKYIMTKDNYPRVIDYAKKYFTCEDEDIKIELEVDKDGNIHWPSRLLLGEYMTKFNYYEEQVISGFTLAYFEGLDYIKIKKKYTGGLMRFGKNKGCKFLKSTNCAGDEKVSYANEFYLPTNIDANYVNSPEPSCSSGRLSKTVHKLYHYDTPPATAEYCINNYSGPSWTNYCPISEYQNDNKLENVYEGRCSNGNNAGNSFCVLNSLTKGDTVINIKAECLSMSCSERSLSIQLGEEYVVCPRKGGKIEVDGYYFMS